jgi:hypothetical protein
MLACERRLALRALGGQIQFKSIQIGANTPARFVPADNTKA